MMDGLCRNLKLADLFIPCESVTSSIYEYKLLPLIGYKTENEKHKLFQIYFSKSYFILKHISVYKQTFFKRYHRYK